MAQSDLLSLWNSAIGNIGVKTSIASITEESAEAAACALNYRQVVEDILRETDWNCVRRRVALEEPASGAVWPPSWEYMYEYPTDCLKVRGFDNGVQASRQGGWAQYPYEVADDATAGPVIYMNVTEPVLIYTSYLYNTTTAYWEAKFDSALKSAISWALAAKIAGSLTGNAATITAARQEAMRTLAEARAANANESSPNSMDAVPSESLAVRGYVDCPDGYPLVNWPT